MTALHRAVAALEAADSAGCAAVMDPDDLRELVDALMVECPRCDEKHPELVVCAGDMEHCEPCIERCDVCGDAFWLDLDVDCARDEERDR